MAEKEKKTLKAKDVSVKNAKGKATTTRKKVSKKTTTATKDTKATEKKSTVTSVKPSAEPVVETVVKKEQPAKAESSKKSEPKKDKTTKTKSAKSTKTTSKAVVKEVKAEEVKPVKEGKAKKTAKKTTTKKTVAKEEKPKKTVKKTTAKEVAPKPKENTLSEEKLAQYNSFAVDTCIDMAKAMGINKEYEDYAQYLLLEADEAVIAKNIIAEAKVKEDQFTFEKDGYDLDLIPVLIARIAKTVDLKASDFADMKNLVTKVMKLDNNEDETYEKMMDIVRKVLMICQRKNIHEIKDVDDMLKINTTELVVKFMDTAYAVLVNWQYSDVKYYEGFIYSVLSQFEELHQSLGTRAMMDVADLYIIHGDYSQGDANYNYIIRENAIKDLIFYRYAHVYEDIDRDKARTIAGESRQFVDARFDYYEAIKNILEN